VVMEEYSYTSTLPMGRTACTEPQCTLPLPTLSLYASFKPRQTITRSSTAPLTYPQHV